MATATVLASIGMILISMVAGLTSFYIMSDLPKVQRKRLVEEVSSQLMNFVIFIWVGKILLNLSIFIKDPLAILAYPSNSAAFYLAIVFSSLLLIYKAIRKQMHVLELLHAFLPVILVASFVYEFIQILYHNSYSIGYIILLTVLTLLLILLRGGLATGTITTILFIGWTVGVLVLAWIQPYVTVFGYMIAPWFLWLVFIVYITFIIFNKRKRVP